MTRQSLIFFLLISYLSCSIHYDKQNDCNYKVKKALKDASKYITMNKKTIVYTLHYVKLPEIEKSRFEKLRNSIEYASALSIKRLKLQWFKIKAKNAGIVVTMASIFNDEI